MWQRVRDFLRQRYPEEIWLAVLGSPVIALSATLPISTRRLLVAAYAKGCGQADVNLLPTDYPRITAFAGGEVQVRSFAASKHVTRSLNLHWVSDAEWAAALREKLTDGGCAAVICSTVGRAQEVFQRLQAEFAEDELGLFHVLRSWLALQDKTFVRLPDETDALIESVYHLNAPIPEDLEPVHQQDWESSLADYQVGETSKKIAQANAVKLPPACDDAHPSDFTRQGEVDDDNAIAAVTRLGEKSVTVIFVQQAANGLILPGSKQAIDLRKLPKLTDIRALLEHSTRISKKGLVEELLKEENRPKKWTSALLRHCRCVILSSQCKTQVGK
jgi:hypothetical protein